MRENQRLRFVPLSQDVVKSVLSDSKGIHDNASRHNGLACGYAEALEAQLRTEFERLMAFAEQADGVKVPEGMRIPEESTRCEARLASTAVAGMAHRLTIRAWRAAYAMRGHIVAPVFGIIKSMMGFSSVPDLQAEEPRGRQDTGLSGGKSQTYGSAASVIRETLRGNSVFFKPLAIICP